jgi:hypothetical protein
MVKALPVPLIKQSCFEFLNCVIEKFMFTVFIVLKRCSRLLNSLEVIIVLKKNWFSKFFLSDVLICRNEHGVPSCAKLFSLFVICICCRAVHFLKGNVALDVARILLRCTTELASTDIAGHALNALHSSTIRYSYILIWILSFVCEPFIFVRAIKEVLVLQLVVHVKEGVLGWTTRPGTGSLHSKGTTWNIRYFLVAEFASLSTFVLAYVIAHIRF